MKKTLSLLMILLVLTTLTACSAEPEPTADPNSPYPMLLTDERYEGTECYLLFEPAGNALGLYVDIYAQLDPESDTWRDEAKAIFTLVRRLYPEQPNLIVRIFNDTENILAYRPRYNDMIATWESAYTSLTSGGSQITWYPKGIGNGITSEQTEKWAPEA